MPTPSVTPSSSARASQRPTPAVIDRSTLTGRIVFAHDGDIWVMNADGSGRTQLTDHPDEDFDPAWSPDGSQIAFRSHRDNNVDVWLMDADGSRQTRLLID